MRIVSFILAIILLISCSTARQTQEAINTGNYLSAINKSIAKLSQNKTRKGNQDIVLLLEEAFKKHSERELRGIDFLKKEDNPANYEKIYNAYIDLNTIQERIKPLLPLRVYDENRNASFNLKNYTRNILSAKNDLSDFLYNSATNLVANAQSKLDFRTAYEDFKYLNTINPGYKDTRVKIEEAYQKGLDYVSVNVYNDSEIVLPDRLEEDLLNFNTYDLNNLWTRFHANPQQDITYDYEMQLKFSNIAISPEQLHTKHHVKEKRIKDGWEYVLDDNGNVKKDSLGNDIKIDKFITVKCNFYEHVQQKEVQITGNISYFDFETQQQINSYPLASGFIFEHIYGDFRGDERALDDDLLELASKVRIPFPSNEQMVFDSGEDLKNRIKSIIKRHGFN
ncbi:MAG: hypothetical protein QNJ57_10260 [Flavobacteriaceae bacterium]|nr:hypothetical protein [Flavobacteriaceae bacterium]